MVIYDVIVCKVGTGTNGLRRVAFMRLRLEDYEIESTLGYAESSQQAQQYNEILFLNK